MGRHRLHEKQNIPWRTPLTAALTATALTTTVAASGAHQIVSPTEQHPTTRTSDGLPVVVPSTDTTTTHSYQRASSILPTQQANQVPAMAALDARKAADEFISIAQQREERRQVRIKEQQERRERAAQQTQPSQEEKPKPKPSPQPKPKPVPAPQTQSVVAASAPVETKPKPVPPPKPKPAPAPRKKASSTSSNSSITSIAQNLAQSGTPYVFGGKDPRSGLDCSGFVWEVLKRAGHDVPYRTSSALRTWTTPTANPQPGDLVHWPGHVAVYLGNGKVAEASNPTNGLRIGKIWGNPSYGKIP